jgi:hypothetical protein
MASRLEDPESDNHDFREGEGVVFDYKCGPGSGKFGGLGYTNGAPPIDK